MISVRRLLALSALSACIANSAWAEDKSFGIWRYACNADLCQAFFSLQRPDTNELAVSMSLLHDARKNATTLVLRAPEMTALEPGAQLTVPGLEPAPIRFQFCDGEGCVGFLPLAPEMVSGFEAASTVKVVYFPYGKTTPVAYETPVNGFADAVAQLKKGPAAN